MDFACRIAAFNERLREAMVKRGIERCELAVRTGISEKSINQYVYGDDDDVGHAVVYVLAKVLCVSPAWLAGYSVSMDPIA